VAAGGPAGAGAVDHGRARAVPSDAAGDRSPEPRLTVRPGWDYPAPVPMPRVVPRVPGPVPMPRVAPREPGPVPMPEVGPGRAPRVSPDLGDLVVPGPGPGALLPR
jgi:hypothetical protein